MSPSKSVGPSKPSSSRSLAIAGASLCIAIVGVALLVLCSCGTTPQGVAREEALYLCASNGLVSAHGLTPYIPSPASNVWEGFLAVAGAAMAVWATHLHRSVAELKKNGNGNGKIVADPGGANAPPAGGAKTS